MKIFSKEQKSWLDYTQTMYPSTGVLCDAATDQGFTYTNEYSTIYGYVLSGEVKLPNNMIAREGQYFSYWSWGCNDIEYTGQVALFTRIGFRGQDMVGGPLEDSGRLCYIDGCSDTLLVYPPRLGDPSLNALFFPPHINQSYHIHPSIRLGVVAKGSGFACIKDADGTEKEIELKKGMVWCIEERELHRFRTGDESMVVVPFHPDGDWGPTDHNHTMLNRTYLNK
jgi:quercetin dioxygenase-like cupin family protein